MPIYEYECRECGHVFDALQKMSDEPLRDCPDCGQPELRKLLSAPNFRLKGGGWYETDFKDKNKRNLAGGDGAGDAKPSAEKGTDSKDASGGSTEQAAKAKSESEPKPASNADRAKPVDKSD